MSFFVGIAFAAPTRADFERALELARPHAPDARWVVAEKAHLTLVFCAAHRPDEAVISAVAARHAPFSLRLRGGGSFSGRVLWAGVEGDLAPLRALRAELTAALAVRDEHPEYSPHVTLARGRPRTAPEALRDFVGTSFTVSQVTLFESRGGRHEIRAVASLSPEGGEGRGEGRS